MGAPDVLIVARPADRVADRLVTAIEARHCVVLRIDGAEAARLIRISSGEFGVEVRPDLPIFIRPASWGPGDDAAADDADFARREGYAAFWAAAALTSRKVINRPGAGGTIWSVSSAALSDGLRRREMLVSGPEQIEGDRAAIWGETDDFRVAPVALLPTGVPLRARRVDKDGGYELVTVVSHSAFIATRDERSERHGLAARSLALVERHGLDFATVTWEVSDAAATALRLNPYPDETELRYRMVDVIDALCTELLG